MRNFHFCTLIICVFTTTSFAQEKGLRELASSLASQIKKKGKGPVAVTTFVNVEYCQSFGAYLVDRLNILLAKDNDDFEVVTRDRVEEAFKEINLALAKNYDSATFARIGKHVGAKSIIQGSYAVQASAALVSLAAQVVDVETGRIIGGDLAEIPFTGDVKAMLAGKESCPSATEYVRDSGPSTTEHVQKSSPSPVPGGPTAKASGIAFKVDRCSLGPENVECQLILQNMESDDMRILLILDCGWGHSRAIDTEGNELLGLAGWVSSAPQSGGRGGGRKETCISNVHLVPRVGLRAHVVIPLNGRQIRAFNLLEIAFRDAHGQDTSAQLVNVPIQ
jgi:TolB-like protein